MEWIYALIGVTGLGTILSLILKKLITQNFLDGIGNTVNKFFYGIFALCTIGLSKWKYTKGTWNKVFEPYVVIFLKVILKSALDGAVRGLESDNEDLKL